MQSVFNSCVKLQQIWIINYYQTNIFRWLQHNLA